MSLALVDVEDTCHGVKLRDNNIICRTFFTEYFITDREIITNKKKSVLLKKMMANQFYLGQ